MCSKGYTVIPDWMLGLDLNLTEVVILAVIYGFSQDGDSTFSGSQKYLAQKAMCTQRTIRTTLSTLVKKGMILKIDKDVRGVKLYNYKVSPTLLEGAQNSAGRKKFPQGEEKISSQNIDDNIDINNIYISNARAKFDFLKALTAFGVEEKVALAWMQVRKTKRATNTEIAFDKIKQEIIKSGMAPNEAVKIAVENSWSGIKANWLNNNTAGEREKVAPKRERPGRPSTFEQNTKVMDKLFGTNMHGELYGKKEGPDEQ